MTSLPRKITKPDPAREYLTDPSVLQIRESVAWREGIKDRASGRSKMDRLKERDKLRELAQESKRGRDVL